MKSKLYLCQRTRGVGTFKFRIIDEKGHSRYQFIGVTGKMFYGKDGEPSCFNKKGSSQKDTIKRAEAYDKKFGWKKAIYIGEL